MNKYPDFTFAHGGLNVENREQADAWYVENLNMKIVRAVEGGPSFLADPTGRVLLELYSNKSAPTLDLKSTHFLTLHLAFLVEDPQKAADKLVEAGARVIDPFKVTPSGDSMIMLQDPFGLSIQLLKRKEPMF